VSLIDTAAPQRFRFDYRGMHRYLVTLPVFRSRALFVEGETVVKVLDTLRDAAQKQRFDVYAYCFLPTELVLVVRGKDEQAHLKKFLSEFRSTSSSAMEQILGHSLWKKKYFERVLRKSEESKQVIEGVFRLPAKAGLAKASAEYEFQGSFVFVRHDKRRR
jgi:REP element-mobilizing transposase RayT